MDEILDHPDSEKTAHYERLVAEMSELAGGLAHELRNPLSTMMLNLRLMAEDLRNTDAEFEDVRRRALLKLDVLQGEAERLQNLFDEFLRLTGPVKCHPQKADLCAVVRRLTDFFEPLAASKGIDMIVTGLDAPLSCEFDEKQVNQALLNLLVNAQEAMPDGGTLNVRVTREERHVSVAVADTGVGIDDGDRDRVFRPFYSNKPGGTGLGLSLTRRIIHAHGGTLDFDSEPDKGTTFRLRLPLKIADREPGETG